MFPAGVVPIVVKCVVSGVHAPILLTEAVVLVGPMDQPLKWVFLGIRESIDSSSAF